MKEIKFGYDPKNEMVHVEKLKVCYAQPCDSGDAHQFIEVETEDSGAGAYFVIKTDRWAFDDIQELIDTLNDFKSRAGL